MKEDNGVDIDVEDDECEQDATEGVEPDNIVPEEDDCAVPIVLLPM